MLISKQAPTPTKVVGEDTQLTEKKRADTDFAEAKPRNPRRRDSPAAPVFHDLILKSK